MIRERLREKEGSVGKKLLEVPGYTFRLLVTNSAAAPEEIWRDYNHRADVEKRIAELKYDLAVRLLANWESLRAKISRVLAEEPFGGFRDCAARCKNPFSAKCQSRCVWYFRHPELQGP